MLLKKLLASLSIGGSIGTGPYVMSSLLPNSGIVKAEDEDVGFGERCLLDQDICDFMKEKTFKQDEEDAKQEKNPYVTPQLEEKLKTDWQEFLKERDDDYCGFGFFGYKTPDTVKVEGTQKTRSVNNLDACYKYLVEAQQKNR